MSAFNGSGTFIISGTGLPVTTTTTISSTVQNQLNADLATGLSTCITKDGQTTPTANIKLGGFKLTGVAAATASGDALTFGAGTNSSTLAVPTRQTLKSGTAATYTTTSASVRQLRVRMIGGGGGGAGNSVTAVNGSTGVATSFNSVTAGPGGGGTTGTGSGTAGTGGTGTPPGIFRCPGSAGGGGLSIGGLFPASGLGGFGASGPFGGGINSNASAPANSGAGGGGEAGSSFTGTTGGGGGSGEYVEFFINTPAATYTFTVGAGGAGGSVATPNAGGSGVIIVDEFY